MLSSKQRGLTLVELMVVVAVMAIIATVAYPMYTAQVQKTRRADAKIALESIAMAQERFYTVSGAYTNILSTLQVSAAVQGGTSDEEYYTVAVTHPGGDTQLFTATASATGRQAGDTDCASFAINQQGVKTATDGGGTNCW
ncbi:MAG: type IV pilin protein [Sedimenticolaceae bacterium]|jgi:type IV pilus assembly protein PilE